VSALADAVARVAGLAFLARSGARSSESRGVWHRREGEGGVTVAWMVTEDGAEVASVHRPGGATAYDRQALAESLPPGLGVGKESEAGETIILHLEYA
jgi:hypothetical protein